MLNWFLSVNAILRCLRKKAIDAQAYLVAGDATATKAVNDYLNSDYQTLQRTWVDGGFEVKELGNLWRHINFGKQHDYEDIIQRDIPTIESLAEKHAREGEPAEVFFGFEDLLHPVILEYAYQQYQNGHLRDAVLNAFVAVFDLIRERTGSKFDGQALVSEVFSLEKPQLIFSEISTDSGRNDQKGFLQILTGAYIGVRNPKAHSLHHDLDEKSAAQYLVFASLLARRVSEANVP
jgi:uncharacterized protein (TIGR02391 family)